MEGERNGDPEQAPPELEPYLHAARDYVRRATGLELDGSETSLAYLDHYVATVRASERAAEGIEAPMKRDVLDLAAASLGAYFGEVLRAKLGGGWQLAPSPADWRLQLDVGVLSLSPVGMAAAALAGEEIEGYDAAFRTRPDWMGPLGAALAAAPPVDEDYYYSFTGRLETLVHAAEILVELQRQANASSDGSNGSS